VMTNQSNSLKSIRSPAFNIHTHTSGWSGKCDTGQFKKVVAYPASARLSMTRVEWGQWLSKTMHFFCGSV
jgi:hypothetical protein